MIKTKQPQKVRVDAGTEFKGSFKNSLWKYASEKLFRWPTFHIGDFAGLSRADDPFRKGYKQTFTNKVFEFYDIRTVNPPTYNIIDANQEPVAG